MEDVELPSASRMCALVLLSYFLVTAGIAYDIINEPPAIGGVQDENGFVRPQAFMPSRMQGQYIMEGFSGAFMYSLGGLSLIALHYSHVNKQMETKYRLILQTCGGVGVLISYAAVMTFMNIKMPGYLE